MWPPRKPPTFIRTRFVRVYIFQFQITCEKLIRIFSPFSSCALRFNKILIDKYSSSPSRHRASGSENQPSSSSGHERRHKSSSVNNCYLSSSSNGQHQSQYHQQKPLSISANNFSPASNFSDSNKVYKSTSQTTGGTCDKNYQQQPTQQQYNSSRNGNNSAAYLSQSHFDFEHMLSDPNDPNNANNQNLGKQSYNTTASGSSRSSRSYNQQPNQTVNSDQFQGLCFTLNINRDRCK